MAEADLERRSIAYVSTVHGLLHVLELAYGVVLVAVAADLGASMLVLGVLANVFGFAYGLTALPVGILADRISETRLLAVCAIGMGAAAIGVSVAQGMVMLGVVLGFLGVALGLFHPVASAFIARTATRTGLGFAYLGTGGNLGLALGPIMVGAIASGLNWRIAYAAFAVPCVILGLLIAQLPNKIRLVTAVADAPPADTSFNALRPVLFPLALILLANVTNGLVYRGVVTFLPTHLSASVSTGLGGIDPIMLGGSFTTVALLFGVFGQFTGGYLSDRRRREMLALVSLCVSVPALLGVWGFGGALLLGAAATFAFFNFMSQPVFNALIADYCPDSWRGRMYGVYFFCAFGVGSFSASALGYVVEAQGVRTVFLVCAGIGVLSVAFIVPLLVRAVRRSRVVSSVNAA
jgi:MFS family permease